MSNGPPGSLAAFGHDFESPELLERALTHRSASRRNNERLEFLGDAVLNLAISAELTERCPDADEGDLTRLRASLVRGTTLAQLAAELGLGEHLHMGSGELKSGGFRRASILADAFEAVLGAVYLDAGYAVARERVVALFESRLASLPTAGDLKDPKTRLQEALQSRSLALPVYQLDSSHGEAHKQTFVASCTIPELDIRVAAQGSSRRKAEQAAAGLALAQLDES